MPHHQNLSLTLNQHKAEFGPVIPHPLNHPHLLIFDLSENNKHLQQIDLANTMAFSQFIFGEMAKANTAVAVGRYNENRVIYARSTHFQGQESRSVHLGIDLWIAAGTNVFAPLQGRVHSYRNNEGFGDYGPTIILEHKLNGTPFFTLYGHLNVGSLNKLNKGKEFDRGEKIGEVGSFPENGDWPPHLHFQVIADMQHYDGDFPGVASQSTRLHFLEICPNPNLILGIEKLSK
jgi:murein DD-endopeptidase MepM/ murein hydrolase activator NlpD